MAIDEIAQQFLPKMVTDISIGGPRSKVIIDTKFYKEALIDTLGKTKSDLSIFFN